MCWILTFMRCAVMIFSAFVGSSKWTWRGVEFLPPYSWICRLSTYVAISQQCKHGMSLCKDCKELYSVDQKSKCTWHAKLTPNNVDGGAYALPESTVANLSSSHINRFDAKYDEECEYFFNKKIADMCRHSMIRCYWCGNSWDRNMKIVLMICFPQHLAKKPEVVLNFDSFSERMMCSVH